MQDTDPGLYFGDDGAPRSNRFGDIYYSLQDGLSEARAVFLAGCHLPESWAKARHFTVLELGFGTGLNIAALLQLWAGHRPAGGHLHVFTIEGFLMPVAAARAALSNWPELSAFSEAVLAQWPANAEKRTRRGFHYMDFPQWGVSLTLALMDAETALAAWEGTADAVFMDGFSPALNPDMWSETICAAVARRSRPGTRLATFTVAGAVRRGLAGAGFAVEKCPGFGRKRERLEAVFQPAEIMPEKAGAVKRVAIIGAGIAGCALAHHIRNLGGAADVFDPSSGSGASGNAAAMVTPRLDAGDNAISALFADSFAYARDLYDRLCLEAILGRGIHLCESDDRDAGRFARIRTQAGFADGDLELFGHGALADMPGAAGLSIKTALWINPLPALQALLEGVAPKCVRINGRRREPDRSYSLIDADGAVWPGYDAVVIACGEGVFDMGEHVASLDLRPVRGQVERADGKGPEQALSKDGYVVPLPGGFLFGATHDRGDRGTEIRETDRARNLGSLGTMLPEIAKTIAPDALTSRASIRVTTRDYLPVAGEIEPGFFTLTGLGARGFCLAPLLARDLAAEILGAPPSLPRAAKSLLRPGRLSAT